MRGDKKNMVYAIDENILSHHGIKGQKWGVRRYQNPDGSRTAAGKEHYNYKDSDNYKNASSIEKRRMNVAYARNEVMYGTRAANRIEYKVNEQGKDRKKAIRSEKIKNIATTTLVVAGALAIRHIDPEAYKARLTLSNAAVNAYATLNNIPTSSKVKYGLGIDSMKRGKEIADRILKNN